MIPGGVPRRKAQATEKPRQKCETKKDAVVWCAGSGYCRYFINIYADIRTPNIP
jgi:hypothetical protein